MTSESVNFGLALLGDVTPSNSYGEGASSSLLFSASFDLPYFFLDSLEAYCSLTVVAKSTCLGVAWPLLATAVTALEGYK